jgi:glutathione S-transferase
MIVLFGTRTSPFVRRVRVVAAELGVPVELRDTAGEEGQAALRALSPIWKVPAALVDGQLVLDSHDIVDALWGRFGPGPLRERGDAREERNLEHVVDGALDAAINAFYLMQGGLRPEDAPYLQKQRARVDAAMRSLAERVRDGGFTAPVGLGRLEIALVTTLDWMRFRSAWPVDAHPSLVDFGARWADRPSFAGTRPGQ